MKQEITRYPLVGDGSPDLPVMAVHSPYNNKTLAFIEQLDADGIQAAVARAEHCFTTVMRTMPAYKRSQILAKAAELIADNTEDFARTIAQEGGKPLKAARIEVARAASTFAVASREALNIAGEHIPMDLTPGNDNRLGLVIREPLGVIAAITPFNFPLNMVAHKVAPALAAGNTVVLKPSPQTPIAGFKLQAVLEQSGLPREACEIVTCTNAVAGTLVKDDRIAMLTFTGSTEVGWGFRKEVAPGVRLTLELGGNAGVIVHDDADLQAAATAVCRGGYMHAGQTCIAVQRVYVHSAVYKEFLAVLEPMVASLKFGDPLIEDTDVGPLIDSRAVNRVSGWIKEAVDAGAQVTVGGKAHEHNLFEPTVIVNTRPEMSVVCKEVFGSVVAVMQYGTIDQAIQSMNDTRYGLQANVFTANLEVAFKAARSLNAGAVHINDASFRVEHMPAGGRKESGVGLEGIPYAIHEMTQPKFISLNLKG